MPKNKKVSKDSSSSDSDSGPEDRGPAKKQKKSPEEENQWDLGGKKLIRLSEFKGKWYVNVREFYDAGGELKPTKKGVMMNLEQWQKFKKFIPQIDEAIEKNV